MNRIAKTLDSPNSVAICRSARFSARSSTSVGRGWCSCSPGSGIGSPTVALVVPYVVAGARRERSWSLTP